MEQTGIAGALTLLVFYFIPAFVAFRRQHANKVPVMLVNAFLGWTFIGWIVALVWAFTSNTRQQT